MQEAVTYKRFISAATKLSESFTFVSLFSGAGIGDYGLALAGGKCLAACEIDPNRRAVHESNISSKVWGNIRTEKEKLIDSLRDQSVDLVIASPPCQSFSTANSRRGLIEDPEHATRDDRNHLFFEALDVVRIICPKFVVFENVPNFLKRKIKSPDGKIIGRVEEFIRASMSGYTGWCGTICFSSLGVPQRRKRALAIFVRNDLIQSDFRSVLSPLEWPNAIKDTPRNIIEALSELRPLDGGSLDASVDSSDPLHQVPTYSQKHYQWILSIPGGSGKSAWENACAHCGCDSTPFFEIDCEVCGALLLNRPHVTDGDVVRSIKGFRTSYKRMRPDELAPTITTASGHFSSDLKLHPFQHRVLSARECAILQSIPHAFSWPKEQRYRKGYLVREMIGEAIPPLVTFRLGMAIRRFLQL